MKKTLLFALLCLFFTSCNWFKSKPEIGVVLAKHFKNNLYKKFDTASYTIIFLKKLDELRGGLSNPRITTAHYTKNEYKPLLITNFYVNGGLDSLKSYIARSKTDGFNPNAFRLNELAELLATLGENRFRNIDEVYPLIAELELKTADALLRYHTVMKYGSVNPRKYFNRYYIVLKRPDSLQLDSLLSTSDLVSVLKESQQTKVHKSKGIELTKERLTLFQGTSVNPITILHTEKEGTIVTIRLIV